MKSNKYKSSQDRSMKLATPRGMRDFLPEQLIQRQRIIDTVKQTFETYGFAPLETPNLEFAEVLEGKYGEEEKLIYKFEDKGGRKLALRYDLTVPLVRVIAANQNLPRPFKRYAIDRVYRYDRPQKGRYREFYQCDIDIIGVKDLTAEVELLACTKQTLQNIGIKNFTFRISNRALINMLMKDCGISKKNYFPALRAIDKLDKIGEKGVEKELIKAGISRESIYELLEFIRIKGPFEKLQKNFLVDKPVKKEIERFFSLLKKAGVTNTVLDLSLVRGLDYYTGIVFEIDAGPKIGSIGGGGRYDKMIGAFTKKDIPATGISLGLERIMEILTTKPKKTNTQIFVIPIKTFSEAYSLTQKLRKKNIKAEIDLMDRSAAKNLDYASKMKIPYTLFIGETELKKKKYKLKNMKSGKETAMTLDQIYKKFS